MPNDTALLADYSYLSTVAECPRKAYYSFERNLVPREGGKSIALHLGSALHVGLDWLYTHEFDVEGAIAKAIAAWGDFAVPPTHRHAYVGPGHIEVILRNYADDRFRDDTLPIRLRPEDMRANLLPDGFLFSLDDAGYIQLVETPLAIQWDDDLIYAGKIDYPNLSGGCYALWDNKTTRSWLSDFWAQKYATSHQMRGYVAILRELTGLPFDRVYINGVYTGREAADDESKWAKRTTTRSRLFGPFVYSEQMLEETKEWAKGWLKLAQTFRTEAERIGESAWPQNDKSCFKYGDACPYYDLCARSPHIREAIIKSQYTEREFTGVLASGADSDD